MKDLSEDILIDRLKSAFRVHQTLVLTMFLYIYLGLKDRVFV